jgi:hypothetical protein
MLLFTVAAIVGTLLGLRYNVFVLVPVTGAALATVAIQGFSNALGFGRIAVIMIAISAVLQLSYVFGSIIGYLIGRSVSAHRRYSVSASVGISKSV